MLNDSRLYDLRFTKKEGCIEIGDNVMIGANVIILPNVRIGSNVVIGAGSIVTKDIPSNTVADGVPCIAIGTFERLVENYAKVNKKSKEELWYEFNEQRK